MASTVLDAIPGERKPMMNDWKSARHDLHRHLLAWIWSVLLLLQVGLVFFVFTDPRLPALHVAGWVLWALGTLFGDAVGL